MIQFVNFYYALFRILRLLRLTWVKTENSKWDWRRMLSSNSGSCQTLEPGLIWFLTEPVNECMTRTQVAFHSLPPSRKLNSSARREQDGGDDGSRWDRDDRAIDGQLRAVSPYQRRDRVSPLHASADPLVGHHATPLILSSHASPFTDESSAIKKKKKLGLLLNLSFSRNLDSSSQFLIYFLLGLD